MEKIHIVYAADDGYAPYLGVSLASILVNAPADENLNVYIIDGGISSENREKIALLKQIKVFSLFYLDVNTELFRKCFIRVEYGIATFYRLAIPEILPTLEKVIYLDCDVIVRHSIADLWAYDVSDYYLGAVPDLIDYLPFSSRKHKHLLHGKDDFCYFNTGVMLLNLKKIRQDKFFQQCISWLEKHGDRAKYCDQDGLNAILLGAFMRLHPKWNVQTPMYWPGGRRVLKRLDDMPLALFDPSIIHFTTGDKPWKQYSFCKWKSLFHRYRLQTPWRDSSLFESQQLNITFIAMFVRRFFWLRFLWLGGICTSWFFSLTVFSGRCRWR